MSDVPQVKTNSGEMTPVGELIFHPQNPRRGNVEAIAESIRVNGFYGSILVQTSTHHIVAGNHRWKAAQLVGMTEVPVVWADVDDETALRWMLGDNRLSDMATYDPKTLVGLLEELKPTDTSLMGTGYQEVDIELLLAEVAKLNPLPPEEFPKFDDNIPTEHTCPRCGYAWSGTA